MSGWSYQSVSSRRPPVKIGPNRTSQSVSREATAQPLAQPLGPISQSGATIQCVLHHQDASRARTRAGHVFFPGTIWRLTAVKRRAGEFFRASCRWGTQTEVSDATLMCRECLGARLAGARLAGARLAGGRDCVASSPLLPAVGWSSFSRLRPAGSRSLDACAATCCLPVGLSSCAFWCCSKASFCAFFWSLCFAGSLYFGPGTLLVLVLWPGTFAAGGILEFYFDDARAKPTHARALRTAAVAALARSIARGVCGGCDGGGRRLRRPSRALRAPRITRVYAYVITVHRARHHRVSPHRARPARARCCGGGARSLARARGGGGGGVGGGVQLYRA